MKQRRIIAITLQGAMKKDLILLSQYWISEQSDSAPKLFRFLGLYLKFCVAFIQNTHSSVCSVHTILIVPCMSSQPSLCLQFVAP